MLTSPSRASSVTQERKRTVLARLGQLPAPSSASNPSHFLSSPIADAVPPVPALLPPSDRERLHDTIQALVASYLTHHGYVDTAESFVRQLKEERVERAVGLNPSAAGRTAGSAPTAAAASASNAQVDAVTGSDSAAVSAATTTSSALRAEIRGAALSGTASGAQRVLDLVEQHFPALLEPSAAAGLATPASSGTSLGFQLRCRVFVEAVLEWSKANRDPAGMMADLATEAVPTLSAPTGVRATSFEHDSGDGDEDADMLSASVVLEGAPSSSSLSSSNPVVPSAAAATATAAAATAAAAAAADAAAVPALTLESILSLGQSLHAAYSSDPDPQVRDELQAVLGLMAYRDPEAEATGRTRELLLKAEREHVADELNKAILRESRSADPVRSRP